MAARATFNIARRAVNRGPFAERVIQELKRRLFSSHILDVCNRLPEPLVRLLPRMGLSRPVL